MYLAIDIGGTNIRLTKFNSLTPDSLVSKDQFSSSDFKNYSDFLKLIESLNQQFEGIGISMTGQIDSQNGLILDSQFFPDWNNRSITEDLTKITNTKVYVENDAVSAGLAEKLLGAGLNSNSIMYVGVGTGIGAVVINSKNDSIEIIPTEFGHMIVQVDGELCSCGHRGCVEAYSSGSSIKRISGVNADSNDEVETWVMVSRYLAQSLMNILLIYPVETIVLGGGLAANQSKFITRLSKMVEDMIADKTVYTLPNFAIAKFESNSGTIGALSLLKMKTT